MDRRAPAKADPVHRGSSPHEAIGAQGLGQILRRVAARQKAWVTSHLRPRTTFYRAPPPWAAREGGAQSGARVGRFEACHGQMRASHGAAREPDHL